MFLRGLLIVEDERAFPIEMGALILHLWMPVAGRMTKACTAEANRLIRRNTAIVLDVMVVLCARFY